MKLFEEFPPISTSEWMDVVEKDLKGADFVKKLVSKTLDGLTIRPFYRKEDLPAEAATAPGVRPYLRGFEAGGRWKTREQIREPDVAKANAHALRCLNRGADELAFLTYPAGAPVYTQSDMQQLLEGVFIEMVPIHWMAGPFSAQTLAMLVNEANRRKVGLERIQGSIDLDPILDAATGWRTGTMDNWPVGTLPLVKFLLDKMPGMKVLTIRGSLMEKSGASVAQELAFTASLLVEYLAEFRRAGLDLNQVVPRIEIRYAVGSHYFLEIAKLRAARVILANVLEAFEVEGVRPAIHVDTTSSNKTLYDPYVNLLRGTTEAMSIAIGGCDSMTVSAFDQGYGSPDEFSEHLARNTDTLLKEEAFLAKVADPLGGSYYLENLTHSLCTVAWDLFRTLEGQGGFVEAWSKGIIAAEMDRVRSERSKIMNSRRRSIVGTSVHPNAKERRLQDVAMPVKAYVLHDWTHAGSDVESLCRKMANGRGMEDWATSEIVPSTTFNPFRPSWPFEHLRLEVERHVQGGGKAPRVVLALFGDPKMRKARAGFVAGFYGVAGYEISEHVLASPDELKNLGKDADIVVLCSSDAEYLALAGPARAALPPEAKLVVAGYPEESLEALREAGVDEFVHVRSDIIGTLTHTNSELGLGEVLAIL